MKKPEKKNAIFSFFAGVGFLDLGYELNDDFEIVYVNEYIEEFIDAYKYSRERLGIDKPEFGYSTTDVQEYLEEPLKSQLSNYVEAAKKQYKAVGFIAGPPCPDFSVGGKNRGGGGENGKLTQTYADMIKEFKPDFFQFENVKGLWRTKKHRDFYDSIKRQLNKNGYVLADRLVNARWYGVPQDRDRIMLFGFRKANTDPEVIENANIKDNSFPWETKQIFGKEMIDNINWPTVDTFKENGSRSANKNVPLELTVQYWFDANDVEHHINGKDFFQPRAGLIKFKTIQEGDDKKKSYKRLHRWRYSPTCAYGNNEVHLHPYKARRISVAEALSLQSLPRDFVLPPDATLSAKFKMIGNGVPFLLASKMADTLLMFLDRSYKNEPNSI